MSPDMKNGQALGVLLTPGEPARTVRFPKPDWRVGDARYLKPDSTRRLELRPLLIEDMAAGYTYKPGTWMLIIRGNSGVNIRVAVRLQARLRKNTRHNAVNALKQHLRVSPNLAGLIRIADFSDDDPSRQSSDQNP